MDRIEIGKRSDAKFARIMSGVLIGVGVLFLLGGIGIFATLFGRTNDDKVLSHLIILIIFSLLGAGLIVFGVFQIFDSQANNRLSSFPLITYDKATKSFFFNNLSEDGEIDKISKDNFISIEGPNLFFLKRVYLVYKEKDDKKKRVILGFTEAKREELLEQIKTIE